MSPVEAGYSSSLSYFRSVITSRNEVLHWPRSAHGGHHELRHQGQDRKVCWVWSRLWNLINLKFSDLTCDLLNQIVRSTLSGIESCILVQQFCIGINTIARPRRNQKLKAVQIRSVLRYTLLGPVLSPYNLYGRVGYFSPSDGFKT